MYTDKRGEVRFRLKAKNGEIIATSEGYKKKASALNGIESIKRNAPEATVVKLTPEVKAAPAEAEEAPAEAEAAQE